MELIEKWIAPRKNFPNKCKFRYMSLHHFIEKFDYLKLDFVFVVVRNGKLSGEIGIYPLRMS